MGVTSRPVAEPSLLAGNLESAVPGMADVQPAGPGMRDSWLQLGMPRGPFLPALLLAWAIGGSGVWGPGGSGQGQHTVLPTFLWAVEGCSARTRCPLPVTDCDRVLEPRLPMSPGGSVCQSAQQKGSWSSSQQ